MTCGGDPPPGPGPEEPAPLRDIPESWPVLSSVVQARGPIVTLRSDRVQMPDHEVADRQVVEHPGAVVIVALDDAGQVLMIRQYRHPVARDLVEVPAAQRDFVPRHEETQLQIRWAGLDEALDRFIAGDLHNGSTAVGILSAYAARSSGFTGLRPAEAGDG